MGVPDVQAVPQVWDGVEDLSQDFRWLVDVLDRHDDIPVRRRIDEVGEPGGLRLRRDPRGRTCLEEMGVEDLRPYRREGVDEADESREVRLMELGRRQVRGPERESLGKGVRLGPEFLRFPRDPGQVQLCVVESRLTDLVDLFRERLPAVRRSADAHRRVPRSRSL